MIEHPKKSLFKKRPHYWHWERLLLSSFLSCPCKKDLFVPEKGKSCQSHYKLLCLDQKNKKKRFWSPIRHCRCGSQLQCQCIQLIFSLTSLGWSKRQGPSGVSSAGFYCSFIFIPEVSGSGHWLDGRGSERCVSLVATDWDEIIIKK